MQLVVVVGYSDQLVTLEVDPSETIENLKAIIEAEVNIPMDEQTLFYGEVLLSDSSSLSAYDIPEGDVLRVEKRVQGNSSVGITQQLIIERLRLLPSQIQEILSSNPTLIQRILSIPELRNSLLASDIDMFRNVLQSMISNGQFYSVGSSNYSSPSLNPNSNVFDPDYQRRVEDMIQQQNIQENLVNALEYNPESFARVSMLYVNSEVNGVFVPAFVDSGAQMTIMSKSCAEKCNLIRLLDRRYAGVAVGVGSAPIIGRVHLAQMKLGGSFFPVSITVLDDSMQGLDFIFGLDMLRRHAVCIDLKRNCLRIEEEEVPFLSESELPDDVRERAIELSTPSPSTSGSRPNPFTSGATNSQLGQS